MPKTKKLPQPPHVDLQSSEVKKPRTGDDFGQEGTNKTIPVPKPDGAPSEELGNSTVPHIEKSPYTYTRS